jgi:6-hydroxynicotinate 3-monooxygenase
VTGVAQAQWGKSDFAPVPVEMDEVRAAFSGFHPEVKKVLASCPQASKWPILEREPFALWTKGRVVLLGDACHPMQPNLGQGAAMAIEDAVVLVRALKEVGGDDFGRAFKAYADTRYERTARVQKESDRNEWLRYPMNPQWLYEYDAWSAPLLV